MKRGFTFLSYMFNRESLRIVGFNIRATGQRSKDVQYVSLKVNRNEQGAGKKRNTRGVFRSSHDVFVIRGEKLATFSL